MLLRTGGCRSEGASLRFPRSSSDVLSLAGALTRYRTDHRGSLLALFVLLYVFLQSFAIPGPVFLSLLAGPLFGFYVGLLLVSFSAWLGACLCYWLSYFLARSTVERFFPGLLSSFRRRVDANRASLIYQLVFLRISPLLPNWSNSTQTTQRGRACCTTARTRHTEQPSARSRLSLASSYGR